MTDRLAEIEARLGAIPEIIIKTHSEDGICVGEILTDEGVYIGAIYGTALPDFIAAAPKDMAYLIGELKAAWQRLHNVALVLGRVWDNAEYDTPMRKDVASDVGQMMRDYERRIEALQKEKVIE